ncbi:MAG: hypothetical protein ACRDF4_07805, partial [Rhabdochlamydiaceae bacterium]
MPGQTFESVINDRISIILKNDFHIDSRAERSTVRGKRPDIVCYYKGLLIGIECSYDRSDAEKDAQNRIREHMADLVMAVWLKEDYRKDLPEDELTNEVKRSKFDVRILTEETSILPFLEKRTRQTASEGWFVDVQISDFRDFIENSIDFLIKEEQIEQLSALVKDRVNQFVQALSNIDKQGDLTKKYYDLFWKLYGLSLGKDPLEINEIIFGQVA